MNLFEAKNYSETISKLVATLNHTINVAREAGVVVQLQIEEVTMPKIGHLTPFYPQVQAKVLIDPDELED